MSVLLLLMFEQRVMDRVSGLIRLKAHYKVIETLTCQTD